MEGKICKILMIPNANIKPDDRDPMGWENRKRCIEALRIWRDDEYPADYILVSGAWYERMGWRKNPASHLMRDYLIRMGIDPQRIIVEDQSVDTFTNLSFPLEVLEKRGIKRDEIELGIVTEWHQTLRFWMIGRWGYRVRVRRFKVPIKLTLKRRAVEYVFLSYILLWDRKGKKWLARRIQAQRRESS